LSWLVASDTQSRTKSRLNKTGIFSQPIVSEQISEFLDSTRLLFDLQQGSKIAESLSGCLEPEPIARRVTDGLVEKFSCAFARLWLVEPDRTMLRLVASSGMYTHIDGSFARVPMGAFKVGKIAQNQIPFLSNHLAEETWVKDRDWAITHGIRGFAGYPLAAAGNVVGVLAVFTQQAMAPEFLEVLQGLCATVTIALEMALRYQQSQSRHFHTQSTSSHYTALSEQLANVLNATRLILVGTERALTTPLTCLFLQAAEALSPMQCIYGRLSYGSEFISLEAIISAQEQTEEMVAAFGDVHFVASFLGGTLQIHAGANQKVMQVLLTVPYPHCGLGPRLRIHCRSSVLQMAFTHLAYLAGLTVCPMPTEAYGADATQFPLRVIAPANLPLLTDDLDLDQTADSILWIATDQQSVPRQVKAKLDLAISPGQLRSAVEAVFRGETWGVEPHPEAEPQILSDRERQIIALLAQGLRDRDIANHLIISESTVKFHIKNVLAKLNVRTRYQALHHVIVKGWLR